MMELLLSSSSSSLGGHFFLLNRINAVGFAVTRNNVSNLRL